MNNIIFKLYNLISRGKLKKIFNEISRNNNNMIPFVEHDIKLYLEKWGINECLENCPIMTKSDIINHRKKYRSDERAKVFAFTGGSSGESLKVPLSKNRSIIRKASLSYYNQLVGYQIGDRYLFIRTKNRPWLLRKIRNEYVFVVKSMNSNTLGQVSRYIQYKQLKYIIGFPSVIYEIAQYMNQHSINNNYVDGIICTSEPVYHNQITEIKTAFNCKILDRYSNEEVGIIAHQRETDGDLIVDRFGVIVEVVDPNTLLPVKEGEEGKVLVTDLNADLFPIIRYDTDDIAMVSKYKDGQLYSLKKVIGRNFEKIYKPDGSRIYTLSLGPSIYFPLSKAGYSCTFQFAQTNIDEYELRIKQSVQKIPNKIIIEINNSLKKELGEGAKINTVIVEEIPRRRSGKQPMYLNETSHK